MINSSKLYYFTADHEWIDFQGIVAFVGICNFKLTGIKTISKIQYCNVTSVIKSGEVLATILSEDYEILIHMPVDGRIIGVNDKVIYQPERILRDQISNWIAKICPLAPYSREGLTAGKTISEFKKTS